MTWGEEAEADRRERIAAVLAEHVPDAPESRIEWIRSYCEGEHGCVAPIAPTDHKAVHRFMKKTIDFAAALDAIGPGVLPPDVAQDVRKAIARASLFANLRVRTRTQKGRRDWRAATVAAVCRALWTRYRGETLPRWFNEAGTHPFIPFLSDMLDALDVARDARNAADSWAEVADDPALFIEIDD